MSSHLSNQDMSANFQTQTVLSPDEDSDMSDDAKYLKLELNQLRRENKHLRRRLQKYRTKIQSQKEAKLKKQYAILKPEDPFVSVIKQLTSSKEVFEAFGQNLRTPNFAIPTFQNIPKPYHSDTLAAKLEGLREKQQSHQLTNLIDILEQQHNQRQQYTRDIQQFLQLIIDVIQRINKAFTVRATKFRKQYNKIKNKVTVIKLQNEKYRMDIGIILKDFAKYLQKKVEDPYCKDEQLISMSLPRLSFRFQEGRKSNRLTVEGIKRQGQSRLKSPRKE